MLWAPHIQDFQVLCNHKPLMEKIWKNSQENMQPEKLGIALAAEI